MALILWDCLKISTFRIWFPPNNLYNEGTISPLLAWLQGFKLLS